VLRRAACLFFLACSTTSTPPQDSAVDAGTAPALLDPALFDCTSLARPPLERRASTTPECLRDPSCRGRFVAGHRGAGGDLGRLAPEDTLAAYRAAIALGVDYVETDPRPTADGVIVNVHDPEVDRTTDGTGKVADMTLAQVQALRVKSDRYAGDFACERIPTLEDVLRTCKGRAIVLIDANKTDRVDLLVDAIVKTDTIEWAVFDTDGLDKIDAALAIEPRLMVMPRAQRIEDVGPVVARFAQKRTIFVELSSRVFPNGVDAVRGAGLRVFTDVFVLDIGVRRDVDRSEYLRFYDKGADALQTDLPDEVLKAIDR
jgi:glycerophosphoryl diester phosphodiesterase